MNLLGRRASTFHTIPLKYCILALVNILLFLYWFAEGMELSLPVLLFFINAFWDEDRKNAKNLFLFENYVLLQTFFSWGCFYSNFGGFISKITFWCILEFQAQTPSLNGSLRVCMSDDLRKKNGIFTLMFVFMSLIYVLFQMTCLLPKVLLKCYLT